MDIRTILVPVDLSSRSAHALDLAVALAGPTGARLVLLHNEACAPLGMSRAWDWEEHHPQHQGNGTHVDLTLRELLARVPERVPAEAVVTRGLAMMAIIEVARRVAADLIVAETAGPDTDDHTSVVEELLVEAPCPLLALREGAGERGSVPALTPDAPLEAVVATDFSPAGDAAVRYAVGLAQRLPLRLRLLHVLAGFGGGPQRSARSSLVGDAYLAASAARSRLLDMVPVELRERVTIQVMPGAPGETILEAVADDGARLLFMGGHATGLRGLLTRDTARAVLHRATCPIWFVPPSACPAVSAALATAVAPA